MRAYHRFTAKRRALLSGAVALLACSTSAIAAEPDSDLVAKGKYLTTAGDCIACHSAPGGKPFAGGLAMKTPFGTIYTPNITPDKATGIGAWSDDDFYRAVHEGIGHRGEYLYPVFPFPWYTKVNKDDVLAIKAYLFSLQPENAPQKPLQFAFPFNIREALLTWRTAFFKPVAFTPDPNKSDEANRGAYLVEGLGHCGECHNHNNLLGASDWSGKLKGGEISGWYAPNITSDGKEGVGSWTTDEIVQYLHTGSAPGRGVAVGPMKETIHDSLQYLNDGDLHAMAAYLKSFAKAETYKPMDTNQVETASAGANAYLSNCSSCHGVEGKGIKGVFPALAGNGSVTAAGPQNVIRVVLGGLPAGGGYAPMPAAGAALSDQTVAEIVNYVRTAWGNKAPANAEAGAVGKVRADPETATLMLPKNECTPPKADTALAKGIESAGLREALAGVKLPDMLQRIDSILPKVKASAPNAKDDDIVNAMIEAYCPIALADNTVAVQDRPAVIGSFGGLVYGQLHNPENAAIKN